MKYLPTWTKIPFFTFQCWERVISDACSDISINTDFRVETIYSTSSEWYGNIIASCCWFSYHSWKHHKVLVYFSVLYFVFEIEFKRTRRGNTFWGDMLPIVDNSIFHCIPSIYFKSFAVLAVLQFSPSLRTVVAKK